MRGIGGCYEAEGLENTGATGIRGLRDFQFSRQRVDQSKTRIGREREFPLTLPKALMTSQFKGANVFDMVHHC